MTADEGRQIAVWTVETVQPQVPKSSQQDDRDYKCGLGGWTPTCLQRFATSRWFLMVHGFLGTVQAMSFIYFIGTLTTIERRFGIQSKTTGWMLSGNEVSQILMSPFLAYFGGQRNRPVWIAWGVFFSALSCYVLASPHFFFGPGPDALSYTIEYGGGNQSYLSKEDGGTINMKGLCTIDPQPPDCSPSEENFMAPLLIFISQFIVGIGSTLYYSLGQPYIDDNSKKKNTPMLLGTSMAMRTVGPAFGFAVTYFCLLVYIDPTVTPTIQPTDPRWLGAWWLGWVILGTVMMALGFLIAFFPKKLKRPAELESSRSLNGSAIHPSQYDPADNPPPRAKDFLPRLMKILKNKLLIFNMFSGVFYVLGGSGYITYMTRNQEVTWYQDSASANILLGPLILGAMVFGFVLSGWAISLFKPRPTLLLGWNVLVGLVFVISEVMMTFIACPDIDIAGFNPLTKQFNLVNDCNLGCGCETVSFSPVCLNESRLTFFSPCYAGCTHTTKNGTLNMYTNCSCVPALHDYSLSLKSGIQYHHSEYQTYTGTVLDGYCLPECGSKQLNYFLISFVMQFLGSTGKVGNILLNYRAVDPEDKSFASGIGLFIISLFAFIPGPVIFGYVLDASCLLWDTRCGRNGNCLYYDRWLFRLYLNCTAALLTAIGVLLDIVVMYLGRDVDLYEEEEEKARKNSVYKDCEILQDLTVLKQNN